ncbi:UNVERIFIED_CONTAM: hypothetical protein H355_005177 [Colinus virginianus]|nr:hypothetical protein H355_005177 [Colinus virginianus]
MVIARNEETGGRREGEESGCTFAALEEAEERTTTDAAPVTLWSHTPGPPAEERKLSQPLSVGSLDTLCSASRNVVVVIGAQWGDEGKGKLVDALCETADFCARFNGGHNAGHTLVVKGATYRMHLLPCGILHDCVLNVIGNGVVVHLKSLLEEIRLVETVAPAALNRLVLSSRAHLLFDIHQLVDRAQEAEKAKSGTAVGTTLRGVGPCYATKASRIGVRVGDLLEPKRFEVKYRRLVEHFKQAYQIDFDERDELDRHREYAEVFRNAIGDTVLLMDKALKGNKKILVEGANASLLDVDLGTYPYVTSCSTTLGGACTGLGIPTRVIGCCIGVVKAYTTRVGEGPFPTELTDNVGTQLRERGREYGSTTGRPRRCGWLDVSLVSYACRVNGFDFLNLTKLDVLTGLPDVRLCVNYSNKKSGEQYPMGYYPLCADDFEALVPVYETMPGWSESLENCRRFEELPAATQNYVKRIEELLQVRCRWIGVGPDRRQTIRAF